MAALLCYKVLMIDRQIVRHTAILEPWFCESVKKTKHHAFADAPSLGIEQCLDCGKIRRKHKEYNGGPGQRLIYDRGGGSVISR